MLNFMVAILSTTYENMLESGSFKYKCTLFEYCEKYMIAFEEKNIGEIVVHPPPINMLCTLIFPFFLLPETQFKKWMPKICEAFSKTNFWIENIFLLVLFIIFELFLTPFVYLKSFYTIIYSTNGLFSVIANVFKWAALGPLLMMLVLCKDVVNLINILRMHDGCKAYKEQGDGDDEDEGIDGEQRVMLFNEVRHVVITHYLKQRYELLGGADNPKLKEGDKDPVNCPDILLQLEKDEQDSKINQNMQKFQVQLVAL